MNDEQIRGLLADLLNRGDRTVRAVGDRVARMGLASPGPARQAAVMPDRQLLASLSHVMHVAVDVARTRRELSAGQMTVLLALAIRALVAYAGGQALPDADSRRREGERLEALLQQDPSNEVAREAFVFVSDTLRVIAVWAESRLADVPLT